MKRIDRRTIGSPVGTFFTGTPEAGKRANARMAYIESIRVYPSGHRGHFTSLYVESNDGKALPLMELSRAAALGIAKAIIEMVPDISIAADDELVALVADKAKRANDEAKAVVASLIPMTSAEQGERFLKEEQP